MLSRVTSGEAPPRPSGLFRLRPPFARHRPDIPRPQSLSALGPADVGPRLNFSAPAYRCVYTVLAGYITARLAPRNPMRHVWVLAFIGLAMAGWRYRTWDMNLGPRWHRSRLPSLPSPASGSADFYTANSRAGLKSVPIDLSQRL